MSNIDEQSIDEEEDTVNQQWKQVKNIFDEDLSGDGKDQKEERMDYTRHVAGYRGETPAEEEDQ